MTIYTDGPRTAGFLISEAGNHRSRDQATVDATGAALAPGTILGRKAVGAATATAKAGNTGNATISAVTTGAGAKIGSYSVAFTAATKFDVTDPDGFRIRSGQTGTAYADDIGFTITAGGTAMVAGDGFDIVVAAGSGRYVRHDPDAGDGSQIEAAILFEGLAEDAVEPRTVVARDAEVAGSRLTYCAGADTDQKAASNVALARLGIIVR
ncbi:MAG: hypothetical protein BGN87_00170 [Rhizobiales bacterium 65-79]|nr:head decoration protein [Hyphomicrobiales bacterium]OJU02601.1 MAG: hypothetical protein BGN87_00170 [Rhizobiales bacterium 65-79]